MTERFDAYLLRTYGLMRWEYDAMLLQQEGRCAICSHPGALVVDHDHHTGKVRALLCNSCNIRLGVVENAEFLRSARAYLHRHSEAPVASPPQVSWQASA